MTLDEVVLTEIQSHQLFYYMSKSEVSDILGFFQCNSHHHKKNAVPQGNTWASLFPPEDESNSKQTKCREKENNVG